MRNRLVILLSLILLAALPLAGQAVRGFPAGFFAFPPLIHPPPAHAPFSTPVFAVFAAIALLGAGLFLFPRRFGFRPPRACPGSESVPRTPRPCVVGESVPPSPSTSAPRPFPLHGRLGLALLSAAWICAWAPLDLPDWIARHTFFPLWLGFILTVDGLVFRRAGRSLFANRRPTFWLLFPVSAISWWYFEFLNRFVQN